MLFIKMTDKNVQNSSVWLFIAISLTTVLHSSFALSCLDENDKPLDWFVGLKYPSGYDFVYYGSSNAKDDWTKPKYNLSNPNNMIAKTIKQTYSKRSDEFYAYYNDESPEGVGSNYRGHLKGVLSFDQKSGFWLIHSVPKFPYPNKYAYNEGQSIFGQSFICISVSIKDITPIATQLLMMQSSVYNYHLPESYSKDKSLMKLLVKLANNKRKASPRSQSIEFNDKSIFKHHGKSRTFNQDLYAQMVAPVLESSLYVESWIRGCEVVTPCKNKYTVYNIKEAQIENEKYSYSKDHSKWAFAQDKEIICVGDINRMKSQFKRGGGTLCMHHPTLWKLFKKAMYEFSPCQRINPYEQLLALVRAYNSKLYGKSRL